MALPPQGITIRITIEVSIKDVRIDTDKNWEGYSIYNLRSLTLSSLNEDPKLEEGKIWFRRDREELRFTPDGKTTYKIMMRRVRKKREKSSFPIT